VGESRRGEYRRLSRVDDRRGRGSNAGAGCEWLKGALAIVPGNWNGCVKASSRCNQLIAMAAKAARGISSFGVPLRFMGLFHRIGPTSFGRWRSKCAQSYAKKSETHPLSIVFSVERNSAMDDVIWWIIAIR